MRVPLPLNLQERLSLDALDFAVFSQWSPPKGLQSNPWTPLAAGLLMDALLTEPRPAGRGSQAMQIDRVRVSLGKRSRSKAQPKAEEGPSKANEAKQEGPKKEPEEEGPSKARRLWVLASKAKKAGPKKEQPEKDGPSKAKEAKKEEPKEEAPEKEEPIAFASEPLANASLHGARPSYIAWSIVLASQDCMEHGIACAEEPKPPIVSACDLALGHCIARWICTETLGASQAGQKAMDHAASNGVA